MTMISLYVCPHLSDGWIHQRVMGIFYYTHNLHKRANAISENIMFKLILILFLSNDLQAQQSKNVKKILTLA